ncbi:MAG: transposase [Phycisphaeraceae bacterium]|nr:transposase [Phycisphaeraceae bacterium]MCB9848040.1 transposase [Phycisphaeraceae bacterium]
MFPPRPESPLPRKLLRRRERPSQARFLTFSCRHRLPLLGNAGIRDVFVAVMNEKIERARYELVAWVVMPEHVHLVVIPPPDADSDAAGLLTAIKITHAQRVLSRWRAINAPILTRIKEPSGRVRYWQPGGGFDRNVRDSQELINIVAYIHANPVKRGLVDRAELWRWSSIHRHRSQPVPIRNQ